MFGRSRAPEINRPGLTWFNVAQPLSLEALRGRIVVLDFWTFCCINCIHVLDTLKQVERAFPEDVAVIGVHSPKFEAERDPANVQAAIARYGIAHPVVHDPRMVLWREYAVRAWPTLVVVGPDGTVIGQVSGEPAPEVLLDTLAGLIEQFRETGVLTGAALPLESAAEDGGELRFPGKMKRLGAGNWAVADAGHHQIVAIGDDGVELTRFGEGVAGFVDGAKASARFNGPQGLVCGQEAIYVADTGNHAIRRIEIASGSVTTLAGGLGRGLRLGNPQIGSQTALASPWDLELAPDGCSLYFANAGTHQLGLLDLTSGQVGRLAGSGGEDIGDGPLDSATFAQPSGLALDAASGVLYVADSETSSVRAVNVGERRVRTLVGQGLFEFGHRNGTFAEASLQHCLGVAWSPGRVYVADSYNGVARVLDLERREVRDLDDGFTCLDPVCLPSAGGEPAGIAFDSPDRLFLVETNRHRILEYSLTARTYRTWFG